jgi:hypothetical protein
LRSTILGLVCICIVVVHARADEMKILPLSPPAALLTGGAGDRQVATVEKFGQVSIQEISLASKIAASDSSIAAVKQHAQYFDFYFVPIKFGVLGFDGKTCKWMQLGATLKSAGADSGQVFILNVFPATSLKKGSLGADAKLIVSSDLKIATPEAAPLNGTVSVGGSANVTWNWNPLYQQVAAVYDQTRVIWRFDAVGSEFPVGEIEVGAIVAVAKSISKGPQTRIGLDVEMRASFGGGWFDADGLARADATVLVRLP